MKGLWLAALGGSLLPFAGLPNRSQEITYSKSIEPIIRSKCLPCHGSSHVGPFDFSTYEGVSSRIELIRTELLSKNMPPVWAQSDYGPVANVCPLTDKELVDFQIWVQKHMPKGEERTESVHPVQPPKPAKTYRFAVPQPVQAEAIPYWRVYSLPLESAGSLDGFDLIPDNPRVIRNATVAIVPKQYKLPKITFGSMDLPGQYLVGVWAPGYRRWQLPPRLTRKFEKGSKLVVQVHYRPTGKPEPAGFQVRTFRENPTARDQAKWISLEQKPLFIDANAAPVFQLTCKIPKDSLLVTALPEARFYAGRVQLVYKGPGQPEKTVLEVDRWDPYWIGNYSPIRPIALERGGSLIAKFYYSNDEHCRSNEGRTIVPIAGGPTARDEVCRMHLLIGPQ